MKPKLTDEFIQYAIRQLEKGRDTKTVAEEICVTQRHIQRLWAEYQDAGRVHRLRRPGRPAKPLLFGEVKAVLDAHAADPAGVLRTAKNLGNHISHRRVYRIMKSSGLVVPSPAKAKRRSWVGYERIYSNAMWHTDWHAMKDPRMKELSLITYWTMPPDASPERPSSRRPPRSTRWPYSGRPSPDLERRRPSCPTTDHASSAGAAARSRRVLGPPPSSRTSCWTST